MNILFRCDGGVVRGSGHLIRCLTLADALKKLGHQVFFACRADAGQLLQLVTDKGYTLCTLPAPKLPPEKTEEIWTEAEQKEDFELCKLAVRGQEFSWIVVDHYGLSASWENMARAITDKILVIDDLANRRHDCNALLDQNEYVDRAARYKAVVQPDTQILLGGRYALLRPEFADARAHLKHIPATAQHVLILMGSTDFKGLTLRLMRLLAKEAERSNLSVDVVIGINNRQRLDIEALAAQNPAFKLHINHQRVSELMLNADIAFGAGGTATWELCCMGVPTLMITFADNQIKVAADADAAGFAHYLGAFDQISDQEILSAFKTLAQNAPARQEMRSQAIAIIDGAGAQRVAFLIAGHSDLITLRPATADDSEDILRWRNDPDTRSVSMNTDEVAVDTHRAWYAEKLKSPAAILLIGTYAGHKIGFVRYDLNDDVATVSINLNPDWRSLGMGQLILQKAEDFIPPHIDRIEAEIKPGNAASLKAFETAGFMPGHATENSIIYLKRLA